MKSYIVVAIGGAIGMVIGGTCGFIFAKKREQKRADSEIASVKKAFKTKYQKKPAGDISENKVKNADPNIKPTSSKIKIDYASRSERKDYTKYVSTNTKQEEPTDMKDDKTTVKPRIIKPKEYDEINDYAKEQLICYADGYLCDDDYCVIEASDGTIVPANFRNHFGEYEDDAVYVRNDRLKTDYEILLSQRTYAELIENNPYLNG